MRALTTIDLATWWPSTVRFFDEAPEHVWVVRKRDDPVGFMIVATSDDQVPIDDDPMLVPWIEHARSLADGGTAVIWRNARTLDDDAAVQGLLGAAGLALSGVANPRFLYLPIDPLYPGAEDFSASLGAVRVPELDIDLGDGVTQCHIVDTGPGGTLGAQLAAVLAESGEEPPAPRSAPIDDAAVRAALRDWDRPDLLAECPFATGGTPAERARSVRSTVRRAVGAAFGSSPRELLLVQVLEAGYLGRTSTHEQAAIDLHLSRSAYYRHLRTAADRVVSQLVSTPVDAGGT